MASTDIPSAIKPPLETSLTAELFAAEVPVEVEPLVTVTLTLPVAFAVLESALLARLDNGDV